MQPLFRPEAVSHANRRLDGGVLLPARLSIWLLGGAVAAVLALAIGFATNATYARTETVPGRLASSAALMRPMLADVSVARVPAAPGELLAELYVPSHAVGLVKPGQPLRLKYDAFPVERHGAYEGFVTDVSLAVLQPSEVAVPDLRLAAPVFRIHARLADQAVRVGDVRVPLRAGMLLRADIVVERRSILDWLVERTDAAGR